MGTWAQNKDKYLRRTYGGLTFAQFQKMQKLQKNKCAICGRPPKKNDLNVDHDHQTGRVRGLLCLRCNKYRVGASRAEHAELHRRIAAYLESSFDGRKL